MDRQQKDRFKYVAARAGYSMAEAINCLVAAFLAGKIKLPKKEG